MIVDNRPYELVVGAGPAVDPDLQRAATACRCATRRFAPPGARAATGASRRRSQAWWPASTWSLARSWKRVKSLLVLEAMKMENEIRAPRGGTVRQVSVKPGQTVTLNRAAAGDRVRRKESLHDDIRLHWRAWPSVQYNEMPIDRVMTDVLLPVSGTQASSTWQQRPAPIPEERIAYDLIRDLLLPAGVLPGALHRHDTTTPAITPRFFDACCACLAHNLSTAADSISLSNCLSVLQN